MANICFLCFLLLLLLCLSVLSATTSKQVYIVHTNHNSKPDTYTTHHEWYQSLTSTSDSILYTYTTAFHGFAAYLDSEEAESLKKLDNVLTVFEDTVHSLHTTHSPQFLGLDSNFHLIDDDDGGSGSGGGGREFQEIERAAHDVIIGVLDTGIWPESKSFNDIGLPEIPKRWKGKCITSHDFNAKKLCNRKLIGAYDFTKAYKKRTNSSETVSPRDYFGHGTHTASTAAGSPVINASMFGYAKGTARGMAINARISSYKVCGVLYCFDADVLAGIDRALKDGVDVLSLSIGEDLSDQIPYYYTPGIIAKFRAALHGVFISCSAGNDGLKSSVRCVAPWILTVGAGSIDRNFPAYAVLGNREVFRGVSLYTGRRLGNKPIDLVYHDKHNLSNFCTTLDPYLVRDKIVICDVGGTTIGAQKGLAVHKAGGVGMILVDTTAVKVLNDENHFVPTVVVGKNAGNLIKEYAKSYSNPTVVLGFKGTVVNAQPSPMVASFSSRGPNPVTPQILKPDIIAPGVNILAAWGLVSPTLLEEDDRIAEFIFLSGTSMSCPHASGIAALLKAAHPDWSSSAIKSAIMTTAYTIDNTNSIIRDSATGSSSNPWAYGSGHIDPRKAFSPGLVYNISNDEYWKFFCTVTNQTNDDCPSQFNDVSELNYPSFSIIFGKTTVFKYIRELTNVGAAMSTYQVSVTAPSAITVRVKPRKLVFRNVGEKQKYSATFMSNKRPVGGVAFGSITWRNGPHQVRSPVAFTWI